MAHGTEWANPTVRSDSWHRVLHCYRSKMSGLYVQIFNNSAIVKDLGVVNDT